MFKSTKKMGPISTCHRNWHAALNEKRDSRHCSYIHGYGRYIEFTFSGTYDACQWIVDFGNLKDVKKWLEEQWDHAVLVSSDDPEMETLEELHNKNLIKLTVIDVDNGLEWGPGMEGSCKHVYDSVSPIIFDKTNGRAWISKIQIWEHENNSAIYEPEQPFKNKIKLSGDF